MKKVLLILITVLALCALAGTAIAANFYINGYVDVNGGTCDPNEPCQTHIDNLLGGYILTGECMTGNVGNMDTNTWVLTKVECFGAGIYTELQGYPDIDILPLVSFDVKRSALSAAAVDRLQDIITEYGITGNCDSSSFDSYADVITCIAHQIIPTWTIDYWSYF